MENKFKRIKEDRDAVKVKIDSITSYIDLIGKDPDYSDDSFYINSVIRDCNLERQMLQMRLDTLTVKKTMLLTENTLPVFKFRDSNLDRDYFVGYNSWEPTHTDPSLKIVPEKGSTCNSNFDKPVYGFACMHNRKNELKIKFGQFERIGIYSLFPETFGSIEMIFSINKKINETDIKKRFVDPCHKFNTKVDLVLTYYNWECDKRPRLDQNAVMLNMVDSVSSIVRSYEFDGVTIDFDINKMDIPDIMLYREFIFKLQKEFQTFKKKHNLNIIISAQVVLDTTKYSLPSKKQLEPKDKKTKLALLLEPDHIDYIDLVLINLDFSYLAKRNRYKAVCPISGIQDNNKDTIGILEMLNTLHNQYPNIKKIIGVLPLYGNLWKREGINNKCISSIIQRQFPEDEVAETFKYDFKFLKDDTSVFIDDLSTGKMEKKVKLIHDSCYGIGLWNIEYGDSNFYNILFDITNEYLDTINFLFHPRLFVIKYLTGIREFFGPNRNILGCFISVYTVLFFATILILKLMGYEKYLLRYKLIFVCAGSILVLFSTIYLFAVPINDTVRSVTILFLAIILLLILSFFVHIYRLVQGKDLP